MRKWLAVLSGCLAAVFLACDRQDSPLVTSVPPTDEQPVALEMPADVQKLFDPYILPEGEPVPMESLVPAGDIFPDGVIDGYDVYAVTILWGHLYNTSPPPAVTTDWSGTLCVNGVAIVSVRETIDFEAGEDSVLTTGVPHCAQWVSFTTGDLDGLSFLVFLKQGIVYFMQPMLTFNTPPFTMSWDFGTLADFSAFYLVDNANAVAIHSRQIWPHDCPKGMISGEWVKDDNQGNHGYFYGLWLDENGAPTGSLAAEFWTEDDGQRLFAGAVSGYLLTVVIATIEGIWYYDDPRMCPLCGSGHGQFKGRFKYLIQEGAGSLQGTFGDYSLPVELDTLPLAGTWREDCPKLATPVIVPTD